MIQNNLKENQSALITDFLGARYKVNLHQVESKSVVVAMGVTRKK